MLRFTTTTPISVSHESQESSPSTMILPRSISQQPAVKRSNGFHFQNLNQINTVAQSSLGSSIVSSSQTSDQVLPFTPPGTLIISRRQQVSSLPKVDKAVQASFCEHCEAHFRTSLIKAYEEASLEVDDPNHVHQKPKLTRHSRIRLSDEEALSFAAKALSIEENKEGEARDNPEWSAAQEAEHIVQTSLLGSRKDPRLKSSLQLIKSAHMHRRRHSQEGSVHERSVKVYPVSRENDDQHHLHTRPRHRRVASVWTEANNGPPSFPAPSNGRVRLPCVLL